jgi:hypothetical protein
MADGNWIQGVRDEMKRKGTEGAFTKQAKSAGMGVGAYADKVLAKGSGASTQTKRRAVFARNMRRLNR